MLRESKLCFYFTTVGAIEVARERNKNQRHRLQVLGNNNVLPLVVMEL